MSENPLTPDFQAPPADPVAWCERWFHEADATDLPNPNAFSLATVDPDGRPSLRMVLRKGFDAEGLVFFTNRTSRKGVALEALPRAAAVFHWDVLDRQLLIEGAVTHTSDEESDRYFHSRPRASRLGAWASRQSQPVADRAALDAAFQEVVDRFGDGPIPRPPHWGGYRIALERVMFWAGQRHRLHDRLAYTRTPNGAWEISRLFP